MRLHSSKQLKSKIEKFDIEAICKRTHFIKNVGIDALHKPLSDVSSNNLINLHHIARLQIELLK
jgi:hypothetical protein